MESRREKRSALQRVIPGREVFGDAFTFLSHVSDSFKEVFDGLSCGNALCIAGYGIHRRFFKNRGNGRKQSLGTNMRCVPSIRKHVPGRIRILGVERVILVRYSRGSDDVDPACRIEPPGRSQVASSSVMPTVLGTMDPANKRRPSATPILNEIPKWARHRFPDSNCRSVLPHKSGKTGAGISPARLNSRTSRRDSYLWLCQGTTGPNGCLPL